MFSRYAEEKSHNSVLFVSALNWGWSGWSIIFGIYTSHKKETRFLTPQVESSNLEWAAHFSNIKVMLQVLGVFIGTKNKVACYQTHTKMKLCCTEKYASLSHRIWQRKVGHDTSYYEARNLKQCMLEIDNFHPMKIVESGQL